MPTPKTTECFKLLCILCRITVYSQTNSILLTRSDQTFSGTKNLLRFFRNQYNQLTAALSNQIKGMFIHLQKKGEKLRCLPVLIARANGPELFYNLQKECGQRQGKFRSFPDKAFHKAISIIRKLPASNAFMQKDSLPDLLFGTSANYRTWPKPESLKISAQEELLINQRAWLLMATGSAAGAARAGA